MANNKFLQILRNFDSTSREQAQTKLKNVAKGNLFHPGTPVVAFYTAETRSFANRSAAKTYGTDATRTYKALLGVMGAQQNDIEIFDIETSVEAILGGASKITTSANSVFPSKTWDFTSLGGVQVVIEQMDELLTTEISNLKTRITNLTGQNGSTYTPTQGNVYTGGSNSLQDAIDDLDAALNTIAGQVTANTVTNTDNSIDIDKQGTNTVVSVNLDENDHVLALDATNGIYTNILIKKVVRTGEGSGAEGAAGTNEVIDTLGTNVKEAYRLYGTDNTQLGHQIDIYKDSSLKEVYLGASTDTIDASTGVITKNTVTDPQSMNFAYQLADGTYSLTKIDVSKFLTESEFGIGLQVDRSGVVGVKKDANSGKVRTAAGDNGLVDVLTVSSDGVKIDNIQAAIDYAVQNAAVTAQGDNYITAGMNAQNNKQIDITADVQTLTASAGTPGSYDATTGAQTTAPVDGTLSGTAESLADGADIATKVKTYVDGAIAIEAARSDAKNKADIYTLNGSADASTVAAGTDTTPTADFTVLTKVNEVGGVVQTVGTGADGSKSVLLKKVAATGAAADVSYNDASSNMGTQENPVATVQDAIQTLDGRLDSVETTAGTALQSISSGNTAISVGDKTNNNQSVGLTLDNTTTAADSGSQNKTGASNALQITTAGLYLCNVWDCGVY